MPPESPLETENSTALFSFFDFALSPVGTAFCQPLTIIENLLDKDEQVSNRHEGQERKSLGPSLLDSAFYLLQCPPQSMFTKKLVQDMPKHDGLRTISK